MMKIKAHLLKPLAVLSATLLLCSTGFAAVVYDNTANNLNRVYSPGDREFGDQIFLDGTDRRITDFQFEYFVSSNVSGNERGELFFYRNDGADGKPGTLLYKSGSFALGTGFQTVVAQGLSVTVPNTFTWTVSFTGVDTLLGEQAGLLFYDPPTAGASLATDFWIRTTDANNPWATLSVDGGVFPANFAARVTAVPEPSTVALGLLASLALLGYRGYKRRSA